MGMSAGPIREQGGALLVDVLVQPRASRARIGPLHGDRVKVSVTAPPVGGAANAAVVELFARALKVKKSDVAIVGGQSSRRKTVRIAGAGRRALEALLG